MSTHTPGPWIEEDGTIKSEGLADPDMPKRGREIIAEHVGYHNIPIIKAAPILWDALESIAGVSATGDHTRDIQRLEACAEIAKAALAQARADSIV